MVDAKFSVPKLNGTNWQSWKLRLEMLLAREDLWEVISEDLPAVVERDAAWKSSDRKAKATLILLLEDSQLSLVRNSVHARDAYEALRKYHEKTTRSVRVSLLKKICSTNLPENGDVEKHLRDFDELFDRLDAASMKLDKDTKICMLLRSLPPSYDGLVTALDSRSDDDISLDVVKSKLVDEYTRQLERRGECEQQEKAMRTVESEPYKDFRTCYFCKQRGHVKWNCPQFLKWEEKRAKKSKAEESAEAKTVQDDRRNVAFTVTDGRTSSWVIDSGASYHMTNDKSFFKSFRKFGGSLAGRTIKMANGKETPILGEGSGVLLGVDGRGKVVEIEIADMKFVPGLSTNLISVGKLAEKKLQVIFGKDGCDIVDNKREVVATGSRSGRLYYLRIVKEATATSRRTRRTNYQHPVKESQGHHGSAVAEPVEIEEEFVEITFVGSKKPEGKEKEEPPKEKFPEKEEKKEDEEAEEEIKLLPLKEELDEEKEENAEKGSEKAVGEDSIAEEFFETAETESSPVPEVRRSQRKKKGSKRRSR